jgi:hypothetical protein
VKRVTQATEMSAYGFCKAVKCLLAAGRLTMKCGAVLGRPTKHTYGEEGEFGLGRTIPRSIVEVYPPRQVFGLGFHDVQRITDLFLVNLKDIELALQPVLGGGGFPEVNL